MDSLNTLNFSAGIPKFDDINPKLKAATHWQIVAVPGLLPDDDYSAVKSLLATYPGASIVDWADEAGTAKGKDTLAALGLQIIRPPIAATSNRKS